MLPSQVSRHESSQLWDHKHCHLSFWPPHFGLENVDAPGCIRKAMSFDEDFPQLRYPLRDALLALNDSVHGPPSVRTACAESQQLASPGPYKVGSTEKSRALKRTGELVLSYLSWTFSNPMGFGI